MQPNFREHPSSKKARKEEEPLTEEEEERIEHDDGRKKWEKWIGEGDVEEPLSPNYGPGTRVHFMDAHHAPGLK